MNNTQREAKKKALAVLRPMVKRNPQLELKDASWELNYLSRIHVSERTVSRYLAAVKKELAAEMLKSKPKPKIVSPKKSEKAHGIHCPLCGNFHKFNPNPIALVGCLGGGNKDNHVLLHYERRTQEWTYAHDGRLYKGKNSPSSVIGFA